MLEFDKKKLLKNIAYGSLIGDAMGIQYEFYSRELIDVPYELKYNPSHFLPIEAGRWSDDGDNVLLVIDTLLESKSKIFDYMLFSKKLYNWVHNGIQELGDKTGVGCGNTVYMCVTDNDFLNNPSPVLNIRPGGVFLND